MIRIALAFNPWQAFSRPALSGVRAALPGLAHACGFTSANTPIELVDVYSRWIDDFPDLIARTGCQGLILSVSANDYAAIQNRLPPEPCMHFWRNAWRFPTPQPSSRRSTATLAK